jgi:hypothetical protein
MSLERKQEIRIEMFRAIWVLSNVEMSAEAMGGTARE